MNIAETAITIDYSRREADMLSLLVHGCYELNGMEHPFLTVIRAPRAPYTEAYGPIEEPIVDCWVMGSAVYRSACHYGTLSMEHRSTLLACGEVHFEDEAGNSFRLALSQP